MNTKYDMIATIIFSAVLGLIFSTLLIVMIYNEKVFNVIGLLVFVIDIAIFINLYNIYKRSKGK